MGYAVDHYCYSSADEAIQAYNSVVHRFYGFSSGWAENHVHAPDSSGVPIYLHYYPLNGGQRVDTATGHYLPVCTEVGPLDRTSLDSPPIEDAVTASLLTVACLIVAWSINVMRRGL